MTESSPEWRVFPLEDALDRKQILAAVAYSLPGGSATRKSADYWSWKHVANSFGRSTGTYGMSLENAVVGVRSFMRWAFRCADGGLLRAVRAVDTSTAPNWRGRGVFTRLTLAAIEKLHAEGVDLIFNTPNSASGPGYLRMGWHCVGVMPLAIRPCRLSSGLLRRSSSAHQSPVPADFGMSELQRATDVLHAPSFLRLLKSHENARAQLGLRTPRDEQYLRWRYALHPQAHYFACVLQDAAGLAAVVLVRPNWRFGLREIVVVEIFARDADVLLAIRCLKNLAGTTRGDYLIAHFAAGSVERRALSRAGFLPVPGQGIRLFARSVAGALPEELTGPAGWDLSLGDLELF